MHRRLLSLFAGFAALILLIGQPIPAHAAYSIYGKVVRVVDGDTVMVDIWGDGKTTPVAIRNAGIQTVEHDQCHFAQATAAMTKAALGKKVHLTAANAGTTSLGRPVRFVDVVNTSSTSDPQLALIKSGMGLWLVIPPEYGRAKTYHVAMEQAAAAKVGMWDNDYCGSGPSQSAKIAVRVQYDGNEPESGNPNSEFVDLQNMGTTTVNLGGWWVRTAAQDSFTIPSNVTLKPGAHVYLHVGKGRNTATNLYWGWTSLRFPNLTSTSQVGSGAYLFDPDGDLRAHQTYPCVVSCTNPVLGKVTIRAMYDPPGDERANPNTEYVEVTSTSSSPVDLSNLVVQVGGSTRIMGHGTVLKTKGSKMILRVGKGTSGYTTKYWGKTTSMMVNAGGTATLRTSDAITIACTSWGTGRC